jgi:hypothetical protein
VADNPTSTSTIQNGLDVQEEGVAGAVTCHNQGINLSKAWAAESLTESNEDSPNGEVAQIDLQRESAQANPNTTPLLWCN